MSNLMHRVQQEICTIPLQTKVHTEIEHIQGLGVI